MCVCVARRREVNEMFVHQFYSSWIDECEKQHTVKSEINSSLFTPSRPDRRPVVLLTTAPPFQFQRTLFVPGAQ